MEPPVVIGVSQTSDGYYRPVNAQPSPVRTLAEELAESSLSKLFTVGLRWWLPLSKLDGFVGVADAASRLWENTVLLSGLLCGLAGKGGVSRATMSVWFSRPDASPCRLSADCHLSRRLFHE